MLIASTSYLVTALIVRDILPLETSIILRPLGPLAIMSEPLGLNVGE